MTPALEINHLHKSFAGAKAVDDLSLTIEPGEIFGLLGPNGAGKSTTINMISGVCRIDRGTVSIFGHDAVRDYRLTRRLVGVMHQEIVTDHFFTIDRALKIHAGYYGVPGDKAWRELLIERLGLGPHLHKSMHKLSGGLKRRFMVAKALIHKPQLLILDEPTAGVDVELRRALWQFVREMNRAGTTVLLTTHYLEEAEQMCGRIAIMSNGKLVALERTAELLNRLEGRSLLLHLDTPLDRVPESLNAWNGQLEEDGRRLRINLGADTPMDQVLQQLVRLKLPIRDLELPKPGLEEVFLKLTGLQLKDSQEGILMIDRLRQQQRFVPWLPFLTLLQKEVRRFLRVSFQTLLTPIVTASLYLFVFGATLGQRISVLEGFSYAQFVIPGLILMGVINNSFANTSSSLFISRYLGNIVDLLVTPLTPPQFILAYTLAAMLRGLLVGGVVLVISCFFAQLPFVSPWAAAAMAALASFLFAQFGLIAAIYANSFDALSMYNNFLILPLIYLGGVFYPVSILPPFWARLSHFNPMLYLIDGFRHAILGVGDLSLATAFTVAGLMAAALFAWAALLLGSGYKLRL